MEEAELEVLLSLDGSSFEAALGYVVEFSVKRTTTSAERPHGISYALVFRPWKASPTFGSTTPTRLIVLAGDT